MKVQRRHRTTNVQPFEKLPISLGKVEISTEEILDDLRYPASGVRPARRAR